MSLFCLCVVFYCVFWLFGALLFFSVFGYCIGFGYGGKVYVFFSGI